MCCCSVNKELFGCRSDKRARNVQKIINRTPGPGVVDHSFHAEKHWKESKLARPRQDWQKIKDFWEADPNAVNETTQVEGLDLCPRCVKTHFNL